VTDDLQEDLSFFDAPFFAMTKQEAASLDPQQRLVLESCYELFENAGIRLDDISGSETGVFIGCSSNDWESLGTLDQEQGILYQVRSRAITLPLVLKLCKHFFNDELLDDMPKLTFNPHRYPLKSVLLAMAT
jgi:3-oxoacyl-(acyl-carrier-protein) synthase